MSEKLVMGYWDCPYCDAKGIEGTLRACPNCGKPRGEDTKFYMKAKSHAQLTQDQYLTEEQAAKKGKGEDWLCSYCGGFNSVLDTVCSSCGHVRDESDAGYAETRQRQEAKAVAKAPSQTQVQQSSPMKRLIPIIAIIAVLAVLFAVMMPRETQFEITGKSWEYSTEIEEYLYVDENDWTLPDGADLIEQRTEVHHWNTVFDHYETETRTYQERVPSGSHVEYSYRDNGDGTFTEVSTNVTDYEYETRYEEYQVPVYVEVPEYATKYYYKIWRWKYKSTVVNAGDEGDEPAFADVALGENERLGTQTKKFMFTGHLSGKDNEMQFVVGEELYFAKQVGDSVQVSADVTGRVVEVLEG